MEVAAAVEHRHAQAFDLQGEPAPFNHLVNPAHGHKLRHADSQKRKISDLPLTARLL
jgi:hypothetical protein